MSWAEWGEEYSSQCPGCRQIHAERTPPGTPPCESCRVELREENEDAARIYNIVRGQVRTRWNGKEDVVTDIDHNALWAAIDGYGVRDRTGCFEKVVRLFFDRLRDRGGE